MTVDVVFSHQGLAATTVVHAVGTVLTGAALVWARHTGRDRRLSTLVVLHTVLGILTVVYVLATYLVAPL